MDSLRRRSHACGALTVFVLAADGLGSQRPFALGSEARPHPRWKGRVGVVVAALREPVKEHARADLAAKAGQDGALPKLRPSPSVKLRFMRQIEILQKLTSESGETRIFARGPA